MKPMLRSLAVLALLPIGSAAAAQSRGVVTGIRLSDSEVLAGTPISMTINGSNPCGAVFIDQRDGTAVTHPIERVPTSLTYTYRRPGTYRIIARGSGNCDGEVVAEITVLPRGVGRGDTSTARLRNMDTDNDGVVTRAEWRGSAQAFRQNDRNGDGVLSGDEVRATLAGPDTTGQTADEDVNGLFADLDVNQDRRISLDEWRGSRRSFTVRDLNGDGILTRRELSSNAGQPIGTSGQAVVVNPAERWTDTGLVVRAGDRLSLDANGRVQLSTDSNDIAVPAGALSNRRATDAPLPQEPAGGLIARIGNTAPLYLGGRNSFVAPSSGRLFLGVNDDHLPDNSGEYRVRVGIER